MTKIDEIQARHAEMVQKREFGYEFWDSNGEIAHNDRAYLLAEVKRLSAPVTDEEMEAIARAICLEEGQTWDELDEIGLLHFYCLAKEASATFLKGRMS